MGVIIVKTTHLGSRFLGSSRDGYHYQDINEGKAIFDTQEHARIEGGTRDAYITRTHNGKGYLMVTTDDTWRVAYIQYSDHPKHYRICKADQYLRNFSDPVDIEGVTAPQHGSFMRITKKEYNRLLKWDAELRAGKK